jgi:phosphate transport system protein
MAIHLQREIDNLKRKILLLGVLVEENLHDAVIALDNNDLDLAGSIIEKDNRIDEMEVEVEEDCLKILALHQPVASDLRYVIALLKINNELERIGDLAVNIAERAIDLGTTGKIPFDFDFRVMGEVVKKMLRQGLDALIRRDPELGRKVCKMDDKIDHMHREVYRIFKETSSQDPVNIPVFTQYLSVSGYLERTADSVTNIAEDVIYMVEGVIARHGNIKRHDQINGV